MDHFEYVNGALHCERVPVSAIAESHGTPAYIYARQTLVDHYNRIESAFAELNPLVCFSVKCCSNIHILRLLSEQGAGFDVVSGGEFARTLEIRAHPSRTVFAGVGKTELEIRQTLEHGIGWLNAESEQELEQIERLARSMNRIATVALRINPDVDPQTHTYTTTGKRETKFGVDDRLAPAIFKRFASSPYLHLTGIHIHIGSPVNRIEPLIASVQRAMELIHTLRNTGFNIDTLNLGGGFGAFYEGDEAPTANAYASAVVPLLRNANLKLILEPGRSIAANAGILIGKVLYTKQSGQRRFVITDAAMTELLRPALYGAYHFVWPTQPAGGATPPNRGSNMTLDGTTLVDVVGPVCESGDFLAKNRHLPPLKPGDLIAVFSTGAYGSVMASRYNTRPFAPEILVEGNTHRLIRRRETLNDILTPERI